MKKIKFLALMMVAGALVFTSCKKDEDAGAPTISFSGANSYEVALADSTRIVFNADAGAEAEISAFTITEKKVDASGTEVSGSPETVSAAKGETSYKYNFDRTYKATDFAGYEKIVYVFSVTDKDGQNISKTLTLTLEGTGAGTAFATEILTGNFWHIEGPAHGAYNLDADATVASAGDVTTKSMINTDPADASGTSSFTGSWNSGNNTEFVKDNAFDYANATVEAATTAYSDGNASGTVTNPAVDDIYIAKKGTIIYVIKIIEVTPEATKNNNGQIKFKYRKN